MTTVSPEEVPPSEPASDAAIIAALEAETNALRDELDAARSAAAASRDTQMRAEADAQNRIRRAESEAEKSVKFAAEKLIKDLLGVADSLELGLRAAGDNPEGVAKALAEGSSMTLNKLAATLEKAGVSPVAPDAGASVNAELHQVMSMVPAPEGVAPGQIVSVLQKGYTLHGRLLRPALVMVAA